MSTRKKTPKPGAPGETFTLVDELMASAVNPMLAVDAAQRVRTAREHLEQIQHAAEPSVLNWRVCAMVGNVIETMMGMGLVQDEEGLLAGAQAVLKAVAEHAIANDVPPRLVGAEAAAVADLVDAFEHVLAEVPHRTMIRVFRETDKTMRKLDAGQRRPEDYIAVRFKS